MRICLCLIKGSNFLFISGPHPPAQSSCLLIPPCKLPPLPCPPSNPYPRPPCWCPACLCFSLLHSRAWGWEAICFVSAGLRLSTNKSSLSHAGVVTWAGGGASLSGFYSNPGTHTGLGGSKGCRGAYRAPSLGPKSIQTSAQARLGQGAGSQEPLTQLLPSLKLTRLHWLINK